MKHARYVLWTLVLGGCAQADVSIAAHHADLGPDLAATNHCITSSDCEKSTVGPLCDTSVSMCVACLTTNDLCPPAHYCSSSTHVCELGCKTSTDCDSGDGGATSCDENVHQCVGCVTDTDCQTGTSCCLSHCVDTTHDVDNCGACGTTCDTTHSVGASCAAGVCKYTGCAPTYADCTMAGADSDGCETLANTMANCGTCGACKTGGIVTSSMCTVTSTTASCTYDCACSTATTATASTCNGTSCAYTCAAGHADCNAGVGTNADGCECATATSASQGMAGCCANACQTSHSDGFGQSYFDCAALSTFNATEATNAANAATTITGTVSGGWSCGSGSDIALAICKQSATTCACWVYSATGSVNSAAGRARNTTSSNDCFCATPTDPSWN